MNKKVGIERCSSYDPGLVYSALKQAVELAGDFAPAGKTVLLKPNILTDAAPEKAVTTHPVFLEAVIRLVREMGAGRILVGDSPGLQTPVFSAKLCGLAEAARKNSAEWVDFTKEKAEIPCPEGKAVKKFTVSGAVREADIIVSLPKLKTHQLMYFTGAFKNTFGVIPSMAKSPYHIRFPSRKSFASMIVDLNTAVRPAYAFMDAVTGMEGPGPGSGDPRHIGLVMASSNLLAMDVAACTVIGYPPMDIPVNREALERGIWLSDFGEIKYPGLSPAELRLPDFVKIPFKKSASQFLEFILPLRLRQFRDSLSPAPEILHNTCVRCGDCVRICPAQTIGFRGEGKERRVVIGYSRCIRCFCCHEVCPQKSIEIAKPAAIRKRMQNQDSSGI